ncbi:MAG: ATP-binding cassette domain-containing protein [Actinobacteria bacterium]|nr:ATP-binding cassette domain-containing protein [Actinomycetota bacterium]
MPATTATAGSVVRWEQVAVRYADADRPALSGLDLAVPSGELCLVVGSTGSGKSTLLRTVNGAVPHTTGGTLHGRVLTAGRDTRDHGPRELADVVGVVPQQPADAFVTDRVEAEIAYGMECLGVPPDVMRRRVEEVLDLLGLVDLRDRALGTLSAGQQQRVALAAAFVTHPQVLVLDEPTSALDPPAAEDVLSAVQRLVHDLGTTVLVAEHRLERVVSFADTVLRVPGDGGPPVAGPAAAVLRGTALVPPVVALGRLLGWDRLPVTVRDARRCAAADPRLAGLTAAGRPDGAADHGAIAVACRGVVVRYGGFEAVRGVDLELAAGTVTALMGRNGAGKTTLLDCLAGLRRPDAGSVTVDGRDPSRVSRREAADLVAFVPADPGDVLLADRVDRELAAADRLAGAVPGTASAVLDDLAGGIARSAHPRDLSSGQRLALALATCLPRRPRLLLLDEPTRGLDYPAKAAAAAMLRGLAAAGHTVLLVTHDVELASVVADDVVVLADGEIVSRGPARQVLTDSPAFAPQVAKVLPGTGLLSVDDVRKALALRSGDGHVAGGGAR